MLPSAMPNASIADLTTTQLRRAIAIKERIEALESELSAMLGASQPKIARRGRGRGKSRRKVATAKSEGSAARQQTASAKAPGKKRRKISPAGRAKMRASAKARWAAVKAKGQTKL